MKTSQYFTWQIVFHNPFAEIKITALRQSAWSENFCFQTYLQGCFSTRRTVIFISANGYVRTIFAGTQKQD